MWFKLFIIHQQSTFFIAIYFILFVFSFRRRRINFLIFLFFVPIKGFNWAFYKYNCVYVCICWLFRGSQN